MLLFFYILKELIFPFLLALGIILSILMMERMFQFIPLMSAIGLEVDVFIRLILYSLPTILMIAIPLALIAGVYAGVNRLSNDSEVTAIKAAGISLSFMFKPVILLSSAGALFVLANNFYLSPQGLVSLEKLKFDILKKQAKINLTVGKINNLPGKMLYVSAQENDLYKGILIADWISSEDYTVIESKQGKIYFDEKSQKITFNLYHGKVHRFSPGNSYRLVRFGKLDYNFTFFALSSGSKGKALTLDNKADTQLTVNELMKLINDSAVETDDRFEYIDELHSRIVMILSCVCFSLLALPMGVYNPRSSKTGNIVYLGLVLILYFWAHAQIRNMLVDGEVIPMAMYLPLLPVLFISFLKYYKLNHNIGLFRQYFLRFQNRKETSP